MVTTILRYFHHEIGEEKGATTKQQPITALAHASDKPITDRSASYEKKNQHSDRNRHLQHHSFQF